MADLVIKPSSGNLVLKDDQNVARLTLATSTGNTTFTGATTLANATITAGTFPAGHIIQTVQGSHTGELSTTSTTWVTIHSNLGPSITPSSASNKILVQFHFPSYIDTSSKYHTATIFRDSTNIGGDGTATTGYGFGMNYNSNAADSMCVISGAVIDSPNTTSSVTYSIRHRVSGGTGYSSINTSTATILLMELQQ